MKDSIAIIPARGGSKRIPRKNIKDFMGKPMIAYAIEAAKEAHIFDEIMVSTDDAEIAQIAKNFGVNVPFMRSLKNSSDTATTADVLLEVLENYLKNGDLFDNICCIYPCSPFLTPDLLSSAYKQFKGSQSLIPVCKYPVPIEWALKIEENFLQADNANALNLRSQDLVDRYFDVGMFYFSTTTALFNYKTFFTSRTKAYIVDPLHCQDIDNVEDWNLAELKYKLLFES